MSFMDGSVLCSLAAPYLARFGHRNMEKQKAHSKLEAAICGKVGSA